MNKVGTVYLLIIFAFGLSFCNAQQDAQYTQYMYNTISVNPAYAGNRGVFRAIGLHRSQWYGLEGAPSTQTLAFDSPVSLFNRVGLGISVINEKIGPTNETYFNIDFSYTIPTSEYGKLGFGLKGVGHLLNVDFQKLSLSGDEDPSFRDNINNQFRPNIGVGIYYYTDKFYFGLSAPNLLETEHVSNNNTVAEDRINFYMISGYVFEISDTVKFKPALLSKLVLGTPLQVDVSANFMLYEKLTFGIGYRWSAALSALAGFQVTDSIMIGFAYDKETTELGDTQINAGSYELIMRFELSKRNVRRLTPRFF